jgi:hypothetical protein
MSALRHARFTGKVTRAGNSEAIRFEQAFFKANPEFSGRVHAQVIAPGVALVSTAETKPERAGNDPVLRAWLAVLERDVAVRPAAVRDADPKLLARARRIAGLVGKAASR